MRTTAIKLIVCVAAIPLAMAMTGLTGSGWFMLLCVPAFPLTVLYAMDFSRELRSLPNSSGLVRVLATLASIPQALFGLLTFTFGVAMVAWVIYNSFVERQPEYTGSFLTFGIGPMCILFGAGWMASAFRRD